MSQQEYPTRPLTPYFLFLEKERKKGDKMLAKESGDKWRGLKKAEKDKYVKEYKEAKEKYDKYVQDVYGADAMTYKPEPGKVSGYAISRIRAAVGQRTSVKAMPKSFYPALARVLVNRAAAYMNRKPFSKIWVL